jgi:TolB-like protein
MPISPWARIKEHKIIQWALGYLATALALTHSEELIARAFDWPEFISRALIVVLALGLPLAITLAWYHGHRASRHISGAEASILAVLLLIGAGILGLFVRPREGLQVAPIHAVTRTTQKLPETSSVPAKPRIAVLPFENLSPDPANAFFTDGLHEEIISTLSNRAPELEVISRTTMMTYRTPKPVQEIARELGATHVLEGSVRREGNAVRLTLQLINARIDQHVWSHDYDRTLKSALTLESDVANEVASQLAVQLAARASSLNPPTRDPQAYDLYLKARLEMMTSVLGPGTPLEVLRKIEQLLSDALVRDPNFARAHAQRAGARGLEFVYNYDTPQHAMPLVQEDLAAAERLTPDDPEVLFGKATYQHFFERDSRSGAAILEAAGTEGLAPVWLAFSSEIFNFSGRFDEAIKRTQHALALDPKNRVVYAESIIALTLARRPTEALQVATLGAAEFPDTFRSWRASIIWTETGTGPPVAFFFPGAVSEITPDSDARTVNNALFPLRLEHRYQEMTAYLGRTNAKTIRGEFTLGRVPVAELRGWAHLLLGDRTAAVRDGHEVLDFVAHTGETKWNRAFLTLLAAEGYTFIGDRTRAIATAGKALELGQWLMERQVAQPLAACVYAWSGADDAAAALLEQISTQIPAVILLGEPATIARDPLYTVPLAGNARYQTLRAKLEAQMAATKLE